VEVRPDGTLTGAEKVWEMQLSDGYAVYRAQRIREEDWSLF